MGWGAAYAMALLVCSAMDLQIDWERAELRPVRQDGRGFRLQVPVVGSGEPGWELAFTARGARQQHEIRGGVWEAPVCDGEKITVDGVREGSEAALRTYLEELVVVANEDVAQKKGEQERKYEALRQRVQRDATQQRMTDRFRNPPAD